MGSEDGRTGQPIYVGLTRIGSRLQRDGFRSRVLDAQRDAMGVLITGPGADNGQVQTQAVIRRTSLRVCLPRQATDDEHGSDS